MLFIVFLAPWIFYPFLSCTDQAGLSILLHRVFAHPLRQMQLSNLEHLEMECLMYEQCIGCYQWGLRDFIRRHSCSAVSDISWGANADYYEEDWYQGRD